MRCSKPRQKEQRIKVKRGHRGFSEFEIKSHLSNIERVVTRTLGSNSDVLCKSQVDETGKSIGWSGKGNTK